MKALVFAGIAASALLMGTLAPAEASGGCGPFGHRGYYGGCRPNGPVVGYEWHRPHGYGWHRGYGYGGRGFYDGGYRRHW